MVSLGNPQSQSQTEAWPASFKLGFAAGVVGYLTCLVKLGKNQLEQFGGNANATIFDD
jgi:hypothetical protein